MARPPSGPVHHLIQTGECKGEGGSGNRVRTGDSLSEGGIQTSDFAAGWHSSAESLTLVTGTSKERLAMMYDKNESVSRRSFVRTTGLLAGSMLLQTGNVNANPTGKVSGQKKSGFRLGAPIFEKSRDPQELARAHVALGYRSAFCPAGLSTNDLSRIRAVRNAFEQHDVVIAEVIAWRNLIPTDAAMRKAAFDFVCERLAIADEVQARCCVCFGGTVENDASWTPHPENLSDDTFDLIVQTVRSVVDAVKPRHTKFTLEMMASVFPNSADSYVALLKAVDRPGFGVHLDPVNLITSPQQYFNNTALIRECFDKLGPWIVSCHAKDIIWRRERGFHLAEAIPGTGNLDFRSYLSALRRLSPDIPLMLEHLSTPEEYGQAYDHICSVELELTE